MCLRRADFPLACLWRWYLRGEAHRAALIARELRRLTRELRTIATLSESSAREERRQQEARERADDSLQQLARRPDSEKTL